MRLRLKCIPPLVSILALHTPFLVANEAIFDCRINMSNDRYDLTSLGGERMINSTRNTPPSTEIQSLRFDLCGNLKRLDGVEDTDQCGLGSRACLTIVNHKAKEIDRIVSVIPLMQLSSLDLSYESDVTSFPMFLSIISYGPKYPELMKNTSISPSLNITLFCISEEHDPVFKSYDDTQVQVEWKTAAGCPLQRNSDSENSNDNELDRHTKGGSMGWVFMLVFALVSYFIVGAYYKYLKYGAFGADLIPHPDFWNEVPYMFSDVVSYLYSAVRPWRSSSHGYVSV